MIRKHDIDKQLTAYLIKKYLSLSNIECFSVILTKVYRILFGNNYCKIYKNLNKIKTKIYNKSMLHDWIKRIFQATLFDITFVKRYKTFCSSSE